MRAADPIAWATEQAARLHAGQVDKIGQPYILHPLAVMETVLRWDPDDRLQAALAVLHDTVEDGFPGDLKAQGEFVYQVRVALGDDVAADLLALTRDAQDYSYRDYIERVVARSERAATVKLADLLHNTHPSRRSNDPGSAYRQQKYADAMHYIHQRRWPDEPVL